MFKGVYHSGRLAALLALGLLVSAPAQAADLQSQVRALVNAADLRQTDIGICIVDLNTGKRVAQINPDDPLMPASNMKVVTTAAALKTLGPDFVFRTEMRLVQPEDWKAQANRPLAGTASAPASGPVLIIHGDGDPALGDPDLLRLHNLDVEDQLNGFVKAAKSAGLQRVARLVVDDRVFDRDFVHPSWPQGQLSAWYCAQVGGVNFYDNCIDVYAEPTTRGQGAKVRLIPSAPFLPTTNRVVTGNNDRFIVNRKTDTNEITFSGQVKTRRTQATTVTIHDPPIFFAQILADRLGQAGIKVDAITRPDAEESLPAGRAIYAVETTLPLVLQRCNKDSQNLFAESLFKRMGRALTGAPGSWDNGAAAVRRFLSEELQTQSASVSIADGSGMSRDNRVTAGVMVGLLAAMRKDARLWPIFRDSLSINDVEDNLKHRFKDLKRQLTGRLYPKTGYIAGVVTISGYIVVPDGTGERTFAFSLLFNNFRAPITIGHIQDLQDRIILLLDQQGTPAPEAAVDAQKKR